VDIVEATLNRDSRRLAERSFVEDRVKSSLTDFFYKQTHRCPIIIPVIMEV